MAGHAWSFVAAAWMTIVSGWNLEAGDLHWSQLPPLPNRLGVAGAFAGVSQGALIVAGGANFPDRMPWEGGRKVWHDEVYVLDQTNGSWRGVGRLPRALGYGISVTTSSGVLCVGGSDSERHYAGVFLIRCAQERLRIKPITALPLPLANGAGAIAADAVYVACGSEHPGERTALNRCFRLKLSRLNGGWEEIEPCPGKERILPVAAAVGDAFYLLGGAALRPADNPTPTAPSLRRVYLRDAWRFTPTKRWERLPDLPRPCVAAASPAPIIDSRLLLLGGDDGSLTGFQPLDRHPGFPKGILALNLISGAWLAFEEMPVSRACLPCISWRGFFVLPSGEVRPGVRSPEVWTLSINPLMEHEKN